jgi:hypothetical protein
MSGESPPPPAQEADRMLAAAADYVEKSNRGQVAECLAMFAPDAVYGSTTVGGHQGIEAISAMMTGFFSKFPAVHWEVQEYALSQVRRLLLPVRLTALLTCVRQHRMPDRRAAGDALAPCAQDYPNCVEFLFTRTGVTNAEGQNTRQLGKEWVCFTVLPDKPLSISRVAVETTKTEVL